MLKLDPELQAFLAGGGTLVVRSRQRAAAVQLAYAALQFRAGKQTWQTPDVLPLAAFAQRAAPDRHRSGAPPRQRQLTAVEEWALWRTAVQQAGEAAMLLEPADLTPDIQRSAGLLADYGITLGGAAGAELELLFAARAQYRRSRQRLRAGDSDSWRQETLPFAGEVRLADAAHWGRATRERLIARGARERPWPVVAGPAATRLHAAADAEAECGAVAAWCRARLEADPGARLLVVAPQLAQCAPRLRRALAEQLVGSAEGAPRFAALPFAFEGGQPLADSPAVQAALLALQMAVAPREFREVSSVLRAHCWDAAHAAARVQLELQLRAQQRVLADWQALAPQAAGPGDTDHGWLAAVIASVNGWPRRAGAGAWARHFAQLWRDLGWPGDNVASAEQQRRLRLDELLGEFAALDECLGTMSAAAAVDWLRAWVREAHFEAESGDVPVTVTAALDDPLVGYDGIWAMGLSADAWPPAPGVESFLPGELLRAAGVARASPEGCLASARAAMECWRQRCGELVLSHARLDGEALTGPSPLLAEFAGVTAPAGETVPAPAPAAPANWPWPLAARLEDCGPDRALPWTPGTRARGGIGVLESQSACPFQATARWRLGCEPLPVPQAGLTARSHGQIVHAALEALWQRLGGSGALRARRPEEWQGEVAAAVATAIRGEQGRLAMPLPEVVWRLEQQRCEQLLGAALALESGRSDFVVQAQEQWQELAVAGLQLRLRIDRLDTLGGQSTVAGGRQLLIDYKTGKPRSTDWSAARPQQVQLQAYAQQLPHLGAAVRLHLYRGAASWRGVADAGVPLAGAAQPDGVAAVDWVTLSADWQRVIENLAAEFVHGEARVAPQPQACRQCELQLLCRVSAEVRELQREEADEDD